MDEWDRVLAVLDAHPSIATQYRTWTDAAGVTHRERIPARFEPR